MCRRGKLFIGFISASFFALFSVFPVFGQEYFGRNKVQYKSFEFSVLAIPHFRIYHYPAGAPAVRDAARMLADWYGRHSSILGSELSAPQKVILYNSFIDFEQTNAVPGIISQGQGGVTETLEGRMVIPLSGVYRDVSHVLGHELVHAFQIYGMGLHYRESFAGSAPLWFIEGMAEYLSKGEDDPLTAMWMRDAVLNNDIPSIDDMTDRRETYFPYRFGEAFLAYVDKKYGTYRLVGFFQGVLGLGVSGGIRAALGMSKEELSANWKNDLAAAYAPGLEGRTAPAEAGSMISGIGNGLNLSPVLSPDGRFLAYFSRNNPFSIELCIADARSGKTLRTLASTDTDSSFDLLQFIDSPGTWSADSASFAFVVERNGKDAIAFADAESGTLQNVITLDSVEGVTNLAWSPDGRRIAFSATLEAVRDLYLLDLGSGELERLTSGRNAELQPTWSPDGGTLAFVTDRGGKTDMDGTSFDSMNIGLMDLPGGQEKVFSLRDGAKHINPQFSSDGRSVFFVADPDGYSDLYRFDLDTTRFFRLTRVSTGISGLSELSPCFSVSRGGRIVFSLFTTRNFEFHALEPSETAGELVSFPGGIPVPVPAEAIAMERTAGQGGQTQNAAASITPYAGEFSLQSVSQAGIGVAMSSYGPAFGAAVQLLFGETLGNYGIGAVAQLNGTIDTLGGDLFFTDKASRLNWGIDVAHIPRQYAFYLSTSDVPFPATADTAIGTVTIFDEEASLFAQLPLSINRRFEGALGYSLYWYGSTIPVSFYRYGSYIGQTQVQAAVPDPLSLFHGGIVYVGDYSFFGFTEPVRGYRYRFEVDQTMGSLFYLTALADARFYLFLKPITLAFRALHVGRYLTDADNDNLSPLFLGQPDLVRGYDYYSIASVEGSASPDLALAHLRRLSGSKVAVFNAEIRVPVLGDEQFGLLRFPYLPLTLLAFFDGGLAWTDSEPPVPDLSADSLARIPVFSAGAAVRMNILGAFVLQIYWAWPFQRLLAQGGEWGFLLEAGW